jgi:hypothetical protein
MAAMTSNDSSGSPARLLAMSSLLLLSGCDSRSRESAPDAAAASTVVTPRSAPRRVACTASVSYHKETRFELELHARPGGYDFSLKHTNGLGCNFEGRLEQLQCSFHDAQPLAFECRRNQPLDAQAPTIASVRFGQVDYRRVANGVSTSGHRIEADIMQAPRIPDRPIACSVAGADADLSTLHFDFEQDRCVVE